MGIYFTLGFYPIDGFNCPKGIHNIIPEILRPYVPTFKNTYSPLFSFYDFSRPDLMPLGIKLFPDRMLISKKRKLYNSIVKFDIIELEKLLEKEKENSQLLKEIILDDFDLTAMGLSCSIGNIEAVHYLLLKGVDINKKIGKLEKTALHIAVENNQELLVKYLLKNGADLFIKDKFGFNIYEKAENRGIYTMKKTLDYFKLKKEENENLQIKNLTEIEINNEKVEKNISEIKTFLKIKTENNLNFEELRYLKDFIFEDIYNPNNENFKPSDMLEINMSNLASKNFAIYDINDEIKDKGDLINLDNFNFYTVNIKAYDRIIKDIVDSDGFKINNKIVRYDDLVFAKI